MPDDRTIEIGVAVPGADAAAEKFDKVGDAVTGLDADLAKLGDGSLAAKLDDIPEPLRLAFKRAEAAAEEFQQKAEDLSLTGPRDLRKVTVAQTLLNQEIERSGIQIDKLPPTAKAAYAKLEAAQKSAINTTSRLKADLDDVNVMTKTGVTGFTGFGNAIEAMGGKAGAAAEKLGFITFAFQQGWQAGMQFNTMVKTDMSEWDDQVSLLGIRFKETFAGIADVVIENANLLKAVFTGDWEAFKLASEGLSAGLDKTLGGITKSNDELRAQRDAAKAATEATLEKTVADTAASEAEKKRADSLAAMILAQNAHIAAVREAAIAEEVLAQEVRDETLAVDAAALAYDKATQALADAQGQLQSFGTLTDSIAASLEAARAKARALSDEYGENSSAAKNAAGDVDELQRSLTMAQQSTDRASRAVDENKQKQEEASKAVEQHTERLGKLKTGQEEVTITADKAADAAKRLATAGADSQGDMIKWSTGVDAAAAKMSSLATASERAVVPITDMSGGFDKFATALAQSGKPLDDTVKNLSKINDQLVKIAANAPAAMKALQSLSGVE